MGFKLFNKVKQLPGGNAFEAFQSVDAALQERQARQQDTFDAELQAARRCLRRFNQEAFSGPQLQAAVEHLLAASRQQRSRFEPYLLLAYAMAAAKALPLYSQYLRLAKEHGAPPELLALFTLSGQR